MMSTQSIVMVVFIGGPLHGTWKQLVDPPDFYTHDLQNGAMVPYTMRPTLALTPGHAVYAPVGMSLSAIADMASSVTPAPPFD